MKQALLRKQGHEAYFLHYFNTTEVYSLNVFTTERKARNYAKKWGYTLVDKLPDGVKEYDQRNYN